MTFVYKARENGRLCVFIVWGSGFVWLDWIDRRYGLEMAFFEPKS